MELSCWWHVKSSVILSCLILFSLWNKNCNCTCRGIRCSDSTNKGMGYFSLWKFNSTRLTNLIVNIYETGIQSQNPWSLAFCLYPGIVCQVNFDDEDEISKRRLWTSDKCIYNFDDFCTNESMRQPINTYKCKQGKIDLILLDYLAPLVNKVKCWIWVNEN